MRSEKGEQITVVSINKECKGNSWVVCKRQEALMGKKAEGIYLLIVEPCPVSVPARNCYWVTGDLSRSNKLLNAFLDIF